MEEVDRIEKRRCSMRFRGCSSHRIVQVAELVGRRISYRVEQYILPDNFYHFVCWKFIFLVFL